MRWIALLLMAGCIGCTPGPRTKSLMPSIAADTTPAWNKTERAKNDGLTEHPINITFGEGIDPELKRTLLYKYGESSRAMYYFPMYVVVN